LASRKQRAGLLNEMEKMTALHRKILIRLMKVDLARKPRSKQRGPGYGHEMDDALRLISESLDYFCAQGLTPSLVAMAARNEQKHPLSIALSLGAALWTRFCGLL
jgi:hypothetical protein